MWLLSHTRTTIIPIMGHLPVNLKFVLTAQELIEDVTGAQIIQS